MILCCPRHKGHFLILWATTAIWMHIEPISIFYSWTTFSFGLVSVDVHSQFPKKVARFCTLTANDTNLSTVFSPIGRFPLTCCSWHRIIKSERPHWNFSCSITMLRLSGCIRSDFTHSRAPLFKSFCSCKQV